MNVFLNYALDTQALVSRNFQIYMGPALVIDPNVLAERGELTRSVTGRGDNETIHGYGYRTEGRNREHLDHVSGHENRRILGFVWIHRQIRQFPCSCVRWLLQSVRYLRDVVNC